jgi:hypothetical protein
VRAARLAFATLLFLAGCSAAAQSQPQGLPATICANEAGWCPLPAGVVIVTGTPCQCFVPGRGVAAGVGRYFLYSTYPGRPVSPYFNPHWLDLPPPPPVIR